ncbi:hypothetical protein BW723_00370 [Polaribacter reichenbachii]|uniref:DUF6377 domain-containing protein n=3 Tax=Polaribacter reichenbachii TaxID=996801 RepID=A0A1B8U4M3_9FLAO|nr:hypothetical protein BW723_00370 [Polaribacter reichenbachii]AUC18699.1 hypothetical protein BTO17_08375 [Polaribacter reichenbachii]OBY66812.1 hypothetical protein LPB301_05120 [Polaribacter reichenbachii]
MSKIFLPILFFLFFSPLNSQNNLDDLITKLEIEMSKKTSYQEAKESRIKSLKDLLSEKDITPENKYFITNKLIAEYAYFSFNSSLFYIEENLALAKKIGNDFFIKESTLKLAKLLATSGRYDESINLLEEINSSNLSKELIIEYYSIFKRCYSELRTISRVKNIIDKYNTLYLIYKDSLNSQIKKLKNNSNLYLAIKEQNYRDEGNTIEALKINAKRLSLAKMGTREYALVTFNRSYMSAEVEGNNLNQKKYLILSAISDIQAAIKDNASLANLAVIFFEEGNVDRAHKYINFSFEDAKFYNSKLRFLDISNVLPVISKSYETKNNKQTNKLKKQLIFISVLSLILMISIFFIIKQNKKINQGKKYLKTANLQLKELNEKLSFTNSDLKRLYEELSSVDIIKEQYIGTFLNLYSEYIDKLDVYRKTVSKYIITNKTKDLLELSKSKKIIESELKIFYENFDKSFLHIYPNFIKNFNELLKEDERIIVKEDDSLTVELRIFALIRLGITNSSKISKILRYSVNTIYNYRVKIRNIAINREEFEDMVKKIK